MQELEDCRELEVWGGVVETEPEHPSHGRIMDDSSQGTVRAQGRGQDTILKSWYILRAMGSCREVLKRTLAWSDFSLKTFLWLCTEGWAGGVKGRVESQVRGMLAMQTRGIGRGRREVRGWK
jgi:hypothetical protein